VIVKLLSLLDVGAGILLASACCFPLASFQLVFIAAIIYICKGSCSILASIGVGYWLDWMGAIDLLSGISLALLYYGFAVGFISYLGIAMTIKGFYSLALSF
jgi:hypothetical protein